MRGAGILLIAPTRRVLLCRRSDYRTWATPGGGIEQGETPRQAALRELYEETRYEGRVERIELLHATVYFALFLGHVKAEFEPELDHEHIEHGWFWPHRPPKPLHPGLCGLFD